MRVSGAIRLLSPLLLTATLAAPAAAQKKGDDAPRVEPYLGSLADAKGVIQERNVPLLVVVIQEGEEANDRYFEGIWKNAKLAPGLPPSLVLLVNDGDHDTKVIVEEREDGEEVEREVCARFETPTCADHKRSWDAVFQAFHQGGQMRTPNSICVSPDGTEHGRFVDVPESPARIHALVEAAADACGEGLTAAQYEVAGAAAVRGRAATAAEDWLSAWRAWGEVLDHAPGGPLRAEAEPLHEAATEGVHRWLAGIEERMGSGEVEAGYARLVELVALVEDTPFEKGAKAQLRKAERNKDWKDRIAAWKRERDAREVLAEIEEHVRAGKTSEAKAAMRKLLRKYEDCEAAADARRRFPDLVDDDGR